jgi:hypothetical protein
VADDCRVRSLLLLGCVAVLSSCGGQTDSGQQHTVASRTHSGAGSASTYGYAAAETPLTSLAILRSPQARHFEVGHEVRSWLHGGSITAVRRARLLGRAPSGSAYVLLAVSGWHDVISITHHDHDPYLIFKQSRSHDALCLMRRGTEGGMGLCSTVEAMRRGALFGALAGQVYGVVPDGVARVRPPGSETEIPVRHNFFAYSAHLTKPPFPQPTWLDAHGRVIPKQHR